ncbi:16S rRNA (cytosine(1402)-N(4))-methyltransferase RsmH [Actinomyces sp. 2119]|nr:16S rRNA (cytosine(1402)-N(4))-methyltransferase RsmH [Actinomyces sp. 2119]
MGRHCLERLPGRSGAGLCRHSRGDHPRVLLRRPDGDPPDEVSARCRVRHLFPGAGTTGGVLARWLTGAGALAPAGQTNVAGRQPEGGHAVTAAGTTRLPPQPLQAEDVARRHAPVLLGRCLDLLEPALATADANGEAGRGAPLMVDCTLGMGGHTQAALDRFQGLRVIGIDRDPQALRLAQARLARYGGRFLAVHGTYDQVAEIVREHAPLLAGAADGTVDAVLMDLGVSSLQLDEAARGFAYSRPVPLDMRMDQTTGPTARDLLATEDAASLTWILRVYGEERFASQIARAVVRRREAGNPVTTSQDLADLVRQVVPAASRRSGGHPAKRTFQALRVAVNSELEILETAVPRVLNCLRVGGRVVVESYQSLEDRIVKRALVSGATTRAPHGLPAVPDSDRPYLELLTHGAVRAGPDEVALNPRAASVRLRAAARTRSVQEAPAPEPRGGPYARRTDTSNRRGKAGKR